MSAGAGRLERAVLEAFRQNVTTEELCRAAYPDAPTIEKTHRVAVLQVVHRFMTEAPRPLDDRRFMVKAGDKRGTWTWDYMSCSDLPERPVLSERRVTEHHEAGHALAALYFGLYPETIETRTRDNALRRFYHADGLPPDEVLKKLPSYLELVTHAESALPEFREFHLVVSFAGPIAEAHYVAEWPKRQRGISAFYPDIYTQSGSGDMENVQHILDEMAAFRTERERIFRTAEKRAEALVRSDPGWRFVRLLADDLAKSKSGTIRYQGAQKVFERAYGSLPPSLGWRPSMVTLPRLRAGWVPSPDQCAL